MCAALSRPHVHRLVVNENATVVLVLDVSGSMEAQDVKPTRLAAAQKALHTFLAKVPARLKVGLVLFAGEAQVATPPTTDHALVSQAIDDANPADRRVTWPARWVLISNPIAHKPFLQLSSRGQI